MATFNIICKAWSREEKELVVETRGDGVGVFASVAAFFTLVN